MPGRYLRATAALTWAQTKLMFREWATVFWSLLFPVLMVVVFGEIYGSKPRPEFGGLRVLDLFVPGLVGIGVASTAFYQVGVGLVNLRERQVLRRLRVSPVPAWSIVVSQIIPGYLMILLMAAVVFATGRLVYGIAPTGPWLSIFGATTIGALSFLALAFLLVSVVRSSGTANAVATGLNMFMMVFSGAIVPLAVMPERFKLITRFVPLTYLVDLLRGTFGPRPAGGLWTPLWVLLACLVAGVALTSLLFKWD